MLLAGAALMAYDFYKMVYSPNVSLGEKKNIYIYIPTGSTFTDVFRILDEKNYLVNRASFEWVAELMKYKQNVHPGKYQIRADMNNKELISLLRSGKQVPVKVIFNAVRTKEQLASKVAEQIEADSLSILKLLNDDDFLNKYGLSSKGAMTLLIPNTYEFYWNTSAEEFFKRMIVEYNKFWNDQKKNKAKEIGLTPIQVSVLASIVEQETSKEDEKKIVAGVYMNRIKKNWKLQADPTLIYALNDFTIRRVLDIYKEIDSPYNTYKYEGLPPGPICIPSVSSLNSVLNYEKHDYLYFCAKEDFSGYHNFASIYIKHVLNARKFQRALDKKKIKS